MTTDATTEAEIEAELHRFEAEERARLGLEGESTQHWRDVINRSFTKSQRAGTTLLICGLTMAHDMFIQAALSGLGYNVIALDPPNNAALQYGKEYGNRGQCNPTYFTVGNVVKYLCELRDKGMSTQDIISKFVFVTAGACGPCRFGTYVTEYRKALRDAGFDGFRVMLFQQQGGLKQATGEDLGLEMNPAFFIGILKSVVLGDVLNSLGYRIRPYEVVPGTTDKVLEESKARIAAALKGEASLPKAIWETRRALAAIAVDRTRVLPKVGIIGEFWAMTTEGDGNYRLQRFLEKEGAEVDIQIVTAWLLYNIWAVRHDTKLRMDLRGTDGGRFGLGKIDPVKRLATLAIAEHALRGFFQLTANALGLTGYHLPDMNEVAEVSHAFYDVNLRGGEGHMEVGKLILNVAHAKVNMTLSVKPFGCMPSSSVSDGVQSLITEMFPEGIFLPIETSGDGAVNVQSRVQMQLFKARKSAEKERDRALAAAGLTLDEVKRELAKRPALASSLHRSPHVYGCSAADLVAEVAEARRPRLDRARDLVLGTARRFLSGRKGDAHHGKPTSERLAEMARRAAKRTEEEARKKREEAPEALHAAPLPKSLKKLPMAK